MAERTNVWIDGVSKTLERPTHYTLKWSANVISIRWRRHFHPPLPPNDISEGQDRSPSHGRKAVVATDGRRVD